MDSSRLTSAPIPTVIIGSGNVASSIAPALEQAGVIDVMAVYSPTTGHAAELCAHLSHAMPITDPRCLPTDAQLYILAVKDDAIARLAAELTPVPSALWVHTSGGVEALTLEPLSPRHGVFYPLQTFSKGVPVDLSEVPVFIEASSEADSELLARIASSITPKVHHADGNARCRMHAAAVFACNFTNHLWALADGILRREPGTDLSVLHPLLRETLRKAMEVNPADAQTGPARRGDRGVIEKHASLLTDDEATLYRTLSQHIIDFYNEQNKL